MQKIETVAAPELIIFDGALGTAIQNLQLPEEIWQGHEGCNEVLNLLAPEVILKVHRQYVAVGAQVLETNTFGANALVLAEYGLAERAVEINQAAVALAKRAAGAGGAVQVCGSIGPGTKLVLLEQVAVEELAAAYREQAEALLQAGVDMLLLETCQDLLQIKTVLNACRDAMASTGRTVPLMVSVTVETTGTLLTGSDIAAVATTLEPYDLFSLGLNCATGPHEMTEHIAWLAQHWRGRISVMPNAGLPVLVGGETVYPLTPQEFAQSVKHFVTEYGVAVVGGCCGTTPAHIASLAQALQGIAVGERQVEVTPRVASTYQAVELRPEIPPFLVGERLNATGSKAFRESLLAEDLNAMLSVATRQEREGAMALDVCTAYAGRDERADLVRLVKALRTGAKRPLMLDTTLPECLEAALVQYPGRPLVNSVNLEDGGHTLDRICPLVKRYGAAVVALTIDEEGMAMTADAKVAVAHKIYQRAVTHGLRPSDLLFDPLTFTLGSGDASLCDSAQETLNAVRRIKAELPGVMTVLGLSNISFGLSPVARQVLNSVFLHEAVAAGLDAAIVDVAKIVPLNKLTATERQLALDLIYNRRNGDVDSLTAFIQHFADASTRDSDEPAAADLPVERQLTNAVIQGARAELDELLEILVRRYTATAIINSILVPAMREVGGLFASGEMLLPFVLQSAEVMKQAVTYLERYMVKREDSPDKLKVLLATVQGDVHDIGKNLVDIILTNNGYEVHNIGIKVPAATIIEKARELKIDVIGLSGLLVKSALVMRDNIPLFRAAGLTQPILLGGAALTPAFVADECVEQHVAPVVYCPDAFAGLKAISAYESGKLESTRVHKKAQRARTPLPREVDLVRNNPVPQAPFWGARHVLDIPTAKIIPLVNEQALFRGRWGYRRGKMEQAQYQTLIEQKVRPFYQELIQRVEEQDLIEARVAYGYFRACAVDDVVWVEHAGEQFELTFPRQRLAPHRCIADYFKTESEGGDLVAFFIVTIGPQLSQMTQQLFASDKYHDYLMLHGYGVELADALAEYWHAQMRQELGIDRSSAAHPAQQMVREYQGARYGFGYQACPDLEAHKVLFKLLEPEKIGVALTENMQMVPEQSTSAIIVHHPQAKYFAID